jgi:hypothetical protein
LDLRLANLEGLCFADLAIAIAPEGEAKMTIGLFLSIMGTLGVVHGVAFVVAPDQDGLQPTIPVANRWGLDPLVDQELP